MARTQQINGDVARNQIEQALGEYARRHRRAKVKVKRQNSVSVRIRVVDPDFEGLDRLKREERVWEMLDKLPNQARSQITFVLLLTPQEKAVSLLDQEFEDPTPSRL